MPTIRQTYVKGKGVPKSLSWKLWTSTDDSESFIGSVSSNESSRRIVGLATHVGGKGALELVAVAFANNILVIKANTDGKESIRELFTGDSYRLAGFGIVQLAMHIKETFGCDVRGYNLPLKDDPSPGGAVHDLLDPLASSFDIDQLWDFNPEDIGDSNKKMEFLCLRAWLSQRLASHSKWAKMISASKAAETNRLCSQGFKCLFRMLKELDMMDTAKPRTVHNDFSKIKRAKDGSIIIHNERYKSRVRRSEKTVVVFVDANGKEHGGKAKGVNGKQTTVQASGVKLTTTIKKVRVHGREELTNAERARDIFLLQLLQGDAKLADPLHLFIGYLWLKTKVNLKRICNARMRTGQGERPLNQSQANVVEAMINPHRPVVITHGPPGTGKTTTISVAMREVHDLKRTAWVVAQSNVGVKNIAESLCKHGVNFKLLVSKEFYFEWHEHIYGEVADHLIRTDELPNNPRDVDLMFYGTRIVLCTISTISNPALDERRLFGLVPLAMLVVDEASQIGILEYLHIFGRFKELKKVCFFGDPKQLPPYGQDAAPTLQSVYDIQHLKSSAYFLDTQYRMPIELGEFISQAVYSSKLQSVHQATGFTCVKFVDVWNGSEERAGKSWKNMQEVRTIVHLVRNYYKLKEHCIITPYDAQRNAIQNALKAENLPWENVFNVDSFQGNESRYVLVSVVRTSGPGFLKSQNRVNVMFTRCKAGMVIVSKREFTRYDSVRKTLLGKLVLHWEGRVGKPKAWCKWTEVAEKKVGLPGTTAGCR